LRYATYLGGVDEDRGTAVAFGEGGLVLVGGSARSADFLPSGLEERTQMHSDQPGLIAALNGFVLGLLPGESQPRYVTMLGGQDDDRVAGVAVERTGLILATGDTQSADFPDSSGATLNGEQDSFLAILNPAGTVHYSAFVGGSDWERGEAVAAGSEGDIYLGGATRSADFPTTPDAFDRTLNDDYDAYAMKIAGLLPSLQYQLFLPVIHSASK
jgi:hypothetical protein